MRNTSRTIKLSFLAIVLGIVCIVFENYYYQYVDADGVLHESLFLPIGAMLILLGSAGFVFALARMFSRQLKK